ncbi:MAG: penicillin-binding transpeptidase domain-containing protein [Oscillospiraceae bacterium]
MKSTLTALKLRAKYINGICIAVFIICIFAVGYQALYKGEENRLKAEKNQLSDTVISAERGTIYDSNMKVLAKSASAWLLYVNPSKIKDDAQKELIISKICEILELDEAIVRAKVEKKETGYQKIAGEVSTDKKEIIAKFISENSLGACMGLDPDTKRYYPYSSFASTIIGFTGADDVGRAGLELKYNDELTGVSGRIITAKNAQAGSMPNEYETTYNAIEGSNLVLTIDEVVQYYLEQSLDRALVDTKAQYAYGIVMDVKTGAILAMTSKPDFDLNTPNKISNPLVSERLAAIMDVDERKKAESEATYGQWRNRVISDTYEPGSVFKTVVASAAIEEGVADLNTSYTCTGAIQVADHLQHCWNRNGHGTQDFTHGLMNSCNPFFITIGQKLGKEKFSKYFEAFGFTEPTGIDLPAEAKPVKDVTYHSLEKMTLSDLSSSSFGQSFQVSPIQMITAISAIANGGKLMKPYVVGSLLDREGNVLIKTEPVVRRQVISEKTSKTVASMMESVVGEKIGSGRNAYVAGYHVAGKTGTSEKLGKPGVWIASFAGFAPADNPQIAVLIAVDEPIGAHSGGEISAPIGGDVLEKTLSYLNVEPRYNEKELEEMTMVAPNLVGLSVPGAKTTAGKFMVKVVGDGDKVVSQTPAVGQAIRKGGVIVVYTSETESTKKQNAPAPNFVGMTMSEANRAAISAGFNIKFSGSTNSADVKVYRQSAEAGSNTEIGTVITVYTKTSENVQDG